VIEFILFLFVSSLGRRDPIHWVLSFKYSSHSNTEKPDALGRAPTGRYLVSGKVANIFGVGSGLKSPGGRWSASATVHWLLWVMQRSLVRFEPEAFMVITDIFLSWQTKWDLGDSLYLRLRRLFSYSITMY
jgi:hypothetical protein